MHGGQDPALFRVFCDEFTCEMNRLRMQGRASLEAARSEVRRIDRELDTPLDLILKGGAAERINAKMVQLEARKAELERVLTEAAEPPPLLHPEMATFYREQVTALHSALGDAEGADRVEAAERLRSLVSKIVLTPENGRLVIDVHGDLAGILAIAHRKAPRQGPMGLCREPCRTQATTASIVCRNTKAARGGRPMWLKLLSK